MREILAQYELRGTPIACEPYGNGHINRTYLVTTDAGARYILQRINDKVFPSIPLLMRNIERVTDYLHAQGLDERHALTLMRTRAGESYITFQGEDREKSGAYRLYPFIEDSLCLDRPKSAEDFRQSAVGIGSFQRMLKDFPAHTLCEVIEGFHDTTLRCRQLEKACKEDPLGRAGELAREIDFALERTAWAGSMLRMQDMGELPLRVTHNDTKLNNVLLDRQTRRALCVIDLDTVMPGLAPNDFGDSIRFGASTAAEDERDLSKVELSLPLFKVYAEGYLSECGSVLTRAERETLPLAAMLMTYECGIRFLADHILGDVYFGIHRPGHNLDRARTQFKLLEDMERKWEQMNKLIHEL